MERRRRGLLPCPAAPICLHVAIVPDEGVSGFPVNQKIADIKEHVVNEMAYNISKKLGRSPHAWADTETASVRSDETDYTDVSCETTYSAPAGSASDHPDGKSPYPNLAKYAKYFEKEKDRSPETSNNYTPSRRTERRRVAMSSSFQHRRRRVHTPAPAAFDDSTQEPSRCGSAPHLNSEEVSYRPTVRPRQGSSIIASPLMRRARPSSCIFEELSDDKEFLDHFDDEKTTRPRDSERRTMSNERHRQPPFHEHSFLPTHHENISMDEGRRSMPEEPIWRQNRHHTEDVKTGSTSSKTVSGRDEPARHSKHSSEKSEAGRNSRNTEPIPARVETLRHHKLHSDYVEAGGAPSSNTVPVNSQSEKHGKHYSSSVETNSASFSPRTTHTEPAGNSKSNSDSVKTAGKTSTSVSSRPGRRVLPNVPTDGKPAETLPRTAGHDDGIRSEPSAADVPQTRRLPDIEKLTSTERHHAGRDVRQHKDPDVSKPSRANTSDSNKVKSSAAFLSDANKSRSSSTNVTNTKQQKIPDYESSSKTDSSRRAGVKSSVSDSSQTKPSASAKVHGADHSKSSATKTEASVKNSSETQKAPESRKISADSKTSQSKSSATGNKVQGSERAKFSQRADQTTPKSHGSKSVNKDERSRASDEQKKRESDCSTGGERTPPSAGKSRSPKSTPGSGSRLTYKVNAATIQPVLMNRKKKPNSSDMGRRSSIDMATDDDAGEKSPSHKKTTPSENVETQGPNDDITESSRRDSNVNRSNVRTKSVTSNVDEDDIHLGSSVNKDCDDDAHAPSSSSHQTGVNIDKGDKSATDEETRAAAEDAKKAKKQQQWKDFMETLQAARTKYSSTDTHTMSSEVTRPAPIYSDDITRRWQIHRDDFAVPTSIAIAADGSAIVADIANCLLDFADVDGNIVHSVTGTKPFSVVVGDNSNVYVGDRRSRTVRVFDIYGSDVAQWDSEAAGFGWISGIAILRNGHLAIIDRERCKVGFRS